MDRAYTTCGGALATPRFVLQLPGAGGFDLIKGFLSWEWELDERKEGEKGGLRGRIVNEKK